MTNFDFLTKDKQFEPFAQTAIAAERIFAIDAASSVVGCRRAMEFAVKWMYSIDRALALPYQDKLVTLINTDAFKDVVGTDLHKRLDYIRLAGNAANHRPRNITRDQAQLTLENLYVFLDFVAYCYGIEYEERFFDKNLLDVSAAPVCMPDIPQQIDLKELCAANAKSVSVLSERREERSDTYVSQPIDFTEAKTRKAYIDVMLTEVGWLRGKNWQDEYPIEGMPNKSDEGAADYVLFGADGKALAVIEAKKTSINVEEGRQQAKLYADGLAKQFGRRPIIFLTNGYDTRILIDQEQGYPEHPVAGIYSQRDLEKEFNKMLFRSSLAQVQINDEIAGRYYQKNAIQNVTEAFDALNRRQTLLVMATGSGKTRTVIALVDILIRHGWVKNFLFLADRNSLVTQAKRAFHNLLPDLSITNLVEEKDNSKARGVFSTYQTLLNCIDDSRDEVGGKLYTSGHFDLLLVDEAHRSIYNKYRDIFTYFDALLVGLTATPKNEIDKNTYEVFHLEAGVPTYGYELEQAVKDGYLVDYRSIETTLKFIQDGIVYDDLSEAEKAEYEATFADENGEVPEKIGGSALNEWIFNRDTIRQTLNILMTKGLKVEYGSKLGKTIVFAKNHAHAEKILEVWHQEYPHYPTGFCQVIDNKINYAQSLIDEFSDAKKCPQIAISVDMLDTGIDVPEILNLVFFKRVLSKAKFWQMIGRGTRLCSGLIDGKNKAGFYIFDFCGNFEFFRANNGKGKEAPTTISLQQQLCYLKTEIVFKLQSMAYQTDELVELRQRLVTELVGKVQVLNRDNFAVRQHLRFVDVFASPENYQVLSYEQTLQMKEHIAPLLEAEADDYTAARFDVLLYRIELAYIIGDSYKKAGRDLLKKAEVLTHYGTLPEVKAKQELIEAIVHTDYVSKGGINEFEHIRTQLRELMKYVEKDPRVRYDTNFTDEVLAVREEEPVYDTSDLVNYRRKVNYYIRQHEDNPAIAKLKGNQPLTELDIAELEKILWSEVGTKADYQQEYGDMPLGELVRSIVGLDRQAAKAAFAKFMDEYPLNSRQMYFIDQLINYIVCNGMLKDFVVLRDSPFTDQGDVAALFQDNMALWQGIRQTIEGINNNVRAAS